MHVLREPEIHHFHQINTGKKPPPLGFIGELFEFVEIDACGAVSGHN